VTSTSIPASWNFVPLKELGDWSGGGTPSKAKPQYWQGGTIPWVSPKDMKTERISDSEDHITKEAVSHSTASLINADSVLIVTRSGILRHTLPVAVNSVPVTVNQDLKALTPRNGIMAEYVAWALRAFSRDILHTCSKQGTTVNSVETSKLLGFEIPVAPRGQQAKIVAEIEKQFSRLGEAVANLKRVKANLKRYKAAVLKAAVEGSLTEDWRKQHPNVEPASKLLERILAERREKWNGRGKYKEPNALDTNDLPSLPKAWTWATVEQLASGCPGAIQSGPFGSQLLHSEFVDDGILAIGIDNVLDGMFSLGRQHRITPAKFKALEKFAARPRDVVITVMATVGRVCVLPQRLEPAIITKHCYRITPAPGNVDSEFLAVALRADGATRQHIFGNVRGQTRPGINGPILKVAPVSLAPFDAEVERCLSVIEELEAAVEANLTRANRLRQSILSNVFAGKLVCANTNQSGERSADIQMAKSLE